MAERQTFSSIDDVIAACCKRWNVPALVGHQAAELLVKIQSVCDPAGFSMYRDAEMMNDEVALVILYGKFQPQSKLMIYRIGDLKTCQYVLMTPLKDDETLEGTTIYIVSASGDDKDEDTVKTILSNLTMLYGE